MLQLLKSKLNSVTGFLILKGLCHNWLVQFVYNANYESLLAMELKKILVNDKINLRVKQTCLTSITSNVTNSKNKL